MLKKFTTPFMSLQFSQYKKMNHLHKTLIIIIDIEMVHPIAHKFMLLFFLACVNDDLLTFKIITSKLKLHKY